MSIVNGNGKGNLLISYLFPSGSGVKEQCDLEMQIKHEISEMMAAKFPKIRYMMGDDECITSRLLEKKWEPIVNAYGELTEFICDCGRCSQEASDYCPNCGAKMDNGDIEERIKQAQIDATN